MKQQRQTSKFKAQVVLELLKGETLEELSRKYAVTVAEINKTKKEIIRALKQEESELTGARYPTTLILKVVNMSSSD